MIHWSVAEDEATKEKVALFLSRDWASLGLPYRWGTVMSSLLYAMEDNGLLLGLNDKGEMAGAIAYTLGTGEDQYRDRTRVEVHLVYLDVPDRVGRNFMHTIEMLAQHLLDSPRGCKEVVFYAAPLPRLRRLFAKLSPHRQVSEQSCGLLDYYSITLEALRAFANH